MPAQTLRGVQIERLELSANFEDDLEELASALDEVDLRSREAEITQEAKDDAMRAFNVTFRASIRLLEAAAILAGKSELAERVRPTRRRRSSGDDAEPAEEAAPAADSTVESTTVESADSAA